MTDIFGYSWQDIQCAQQGGRLARTIDISKQYPAETEADRELLAKHGADGLCKLGYFGVLDRLQRTGVI